MKVALIVLAGLMVAGVAYECARVYRIRKQEKEETRAKRKAAHAEALRVAVRKVAQDSLQRQPNRTVTALRGASGDQDRTLINSNNMAAAAILGSHGSCSGSCSSDSSTSSSSCD